MKPARRAGRALILAVVAVALLDMGGAVQARATLVSSEPPEGAVLAEPPRQVLLRYSEDVEARMATVSLLDGRGRIVRGTRLERRGPRELALVLPALPRESADYYVKATVASSRDFELTDTLYKFRVEVAAGTATGGPGGEAVEKEAGRSGSGQGWFLALLVAVAAGAVAVAFLARGRGARER